MCLIIVSDKPSTITAAVCQSAAKKNGDGIGAMWYDENGDLQHQKWLKIGHKKWWLQWRKICAEAEHAGSQVAVHWRMATHGACDREMCHPYDLSTSDQGVLMMHNGIISGYGDSSYSVIAYKNAPAYAESGKSDTWEYARKVESILMDGGSRLLRNAAFMSLLGEDIGSGNKLVFGVNQDPGKRFYQVNDDQGRWFDGHWFSNTYAWDSYKLSHGKLGTVPFGNTTKSTYSSYAGARLKGTTGTWESDVDFPLTTREFSWGQGRSVVSPRSRTATTVVDIVEAFNLDPDAAIQALSEIPVPSRLVEEIFEIAANSPSDGCQRLLRDAWEVAGEYLRKVGSYYL